MGRPIQLSPDYFKNRIIGDEFKDALKLNYQKWLQQELHIDMYEMLTVLILYSQATLDDRLLLIFDLYKKNEADETMNV